MAPKQRQIRIEQRGSLQAIQSLEQRSDEELESETKYKAAAMAILGARASERFDAEAARGYFQRAIAAARPQERMQIRRMADASLALAERRAGDLKDAVERLGQTPPSGRQLFALRAMGLLVPPSSAGILARMRGILLILILVIALIAVGLGIVELVSLPFGGLGLAPGILLGFFVVIAALAIVAAIGGAGATGRARRRPPSTPRRRRPRANEASAVPAPLCLIVNPSAGGGKAARLAPVAERELRARGLEVRRVDTRDLAHARELGREAATRGETVVALSGDGLLGVLADTLREAPGAVLGLIPGGRGNDLARVLGIPEDPAGAAAVIAAGHTRPVDLGFVDAREGAAGRGGPSSASPRSGSTATPTGSPTRRRRGWAGSSTPTARCGRSPRGARHASTSSWTRRGSATASAPSRSGPPTPRPTAAACAPRPARCSTTACSRSWSSRASASSGS